MQTIVTRVAWSVRVCVCVRVSAYLLVTTVALLKRLNRSRCRLGFGLVGPMVAARIPPSKRSILWVCSASLNIYLATPPERIFGTRRQAADCSIAAARNIGDICGSWSSERCARSFRVGCPRRQTRSRRECRPASVYAG